MSKERSDAAKHPVDRRVSAPDWLLRREGITNRDWKAKKRKELKAIIAAFEVYQMGCAYCPGFDGEVVQIEELLAKMKASHSAKVWGR